MEERMTICNMSVEGGARCGYVNPDQTTYEYIKGRKNAPEASYWNDAISWWNSIRSDKNALYDDVVTFDAKDISPTVTWGITPGQCVAVDEKIPQLTQMSQEDRHVAEEAYSYMSMSPGTPIKGHKR